MSSEKRTTLFQWAILCTVVPGAFYLLTVLNVWRITGKVAWNLVASDVRFESFLVVLSYGVVVALYEAVLLVRRKMSAKGAGGTPS